MRAERQVTSSSSHPALGRATIVKRFDGPETVLLFDRGRLEVITVGGTLLGKGTYLPGWRWAQVGAAHPGDRAPEHIGVVLSGRAKFVFDEDREIDLVPGDFFHIATEYDGWVVGHRACEVLYLNGVDGMVNRITRV